MLRTPSVTAFVLNVGEDTVEPGQEAALRSSQCSGRGGVLRLSQTPPGLVSHQKVRAGTMVTLPTKGGWRQEELLETLGMEKSAQDSRRKRDH